MQSSTNAASILTFQGSTNIPNNYSEASGAVINEASNTNSTITTTNTTNASGAIIREVIISGATDSSITPTPNTYTTEFTIF